MSDLGSFDPWMDDKREIIAVVLNGERHESLATATFARIQQPGEFCMIPWIRIETWVPRHRLIEAPLGNVLLIEFSTYNTTDEE